MLMILEIITHFASFLAMCRYAALKNAHNKDKPIEEYLNAIDFGMFKDGVPELLMEN